MKVIGIAGQYQNGKDTVADHIMYNFMQEGRVWRRNSFAAKVKQIFCDTFGVDLEFIEKWKVIPECPPGFNKPVRQSLQFIGDGFREIQPTVWLDQPFRDNHMPQIISDVRYVNEFLKIKEHSGLNILVVRPDMINDDPNGSEAQIRPYSKWLVDFFKDDQRKVIDLQNMHWDLIRKLAYAPSLPEHIENFDVLICNCGDKQELQDAIDSDLMPIINNFNFI